MSLLDEIQQPVEGFGREAALVIFETVQGRFQPGVVKPRGFPPGPDPARRVNRDTLGLVIRLRSKTPGSKATQPMRKPYRLSLSIDLVLAHPALGFLCLKTAVRSATAHDVSSFQVFLAGAYAIHKLLIAHALKVRVPARCGRNGRGSPPSTTSPPG